MTNYFSTQSETYAAFRPTYPPELFRWIAGIAPARHMVWDCATGNGQAAVDLAAYFDQVIGTDSAANQIAHATAHPKVIYRVAPAESSGLIAHSADVITVAQAVHWFDFEPFYAEARRVLVPGGVLVLWGYGNPVLPTPELDAIVARYTTDTLGPWWPPERALLVNDYHDVPFPFEPVSAPALALTASWTLAHLMGYLRSWSGTVQYAKALGNDPVQPVEDELRQLWGDPDMKREIRWPLPIRAGRVGVSDATPFDL